VASDSEFPAPEIDVEEEKPAAAASRASYLCVSDKP
jgi:hypothetical protein